MIYIYIIYVSKNRGPPKWMVYSGKPYEQMDDLGVPLFLETPISFFVWLMAVASSKLKNINDSVCFYF